VNDRHFPHPASPFATGSIIPGSASASVIRNFAMHKVPDRVDELPRLTLNVEGSTTCPGSLLSPPGSKPPCEYLTANFRTEFNVPKGSLDRYREIYDRVCARTDCGGAGCGVKDDGSEVCQDTLKLRLIDSCEGEMINHDVCARQARQIVDQGVCKKECEKGKPPASQKDCAKICGAPMARPPWYAQGAVKQGGTWVFPKLDELFSGIRNMGLQPGYTKESQASHRLVITNNTSRTSGRWRETTTRTVISRQTGQTGRRLTQQITSEKIVPTDGTFSAR